MTCGLCGNDLRHGEWAEYRSLPGYKSHPGSWSRCHASCGIEAQQSGNMIQVRWNVTKKRDNSLDKRR